MDPSGESTRMSLSTLITRFIPTTFGTGTWLPILVMSENCLFVIANAEPLILPALCSASSSSTNRISSVRWCVYKPASCIGNTHATVSLSLWCECHHPGGVTNTPPGIQSHRIGSTMWPLLSISLPIRVYTPGFALTARSSATLLCRCGRWTFPAGIEFSSDHSTCVSVLVCGHALFPRSTPSRFRSLPSSIGVCLISSTVANKSAFLYRVGSNLRTHGLHPM
mmetsp:Transcript_10022/g.37168  ORF Transcript_10022/g.37168 Transcript_10022/m.37168 type:complete len:223 (+) Transcript_10022:814-1482(+)